MMFKIQATVKTLLFTMLCVLAVPTHADTDGPDASPKADTPTPPPVNNSMNAISDAQAKVNILCDESRSGFDQKKCDDAIAKLGSDGR